MKKEKLQEYAENMRFNPTRSESIMANRLECAGIKYQFQVIIGTYIVDFLIGKTIIEIDGATHDTATAQVYDDERTIYLKSKGFKVVRIRNSDVKTCDISRFRKPPQAPKKSKPAGPKTPALSIGKMSRNKFKKLPKRIKQNVILKNNPHLQKCGVLATV